MEGFKIDPIFMTQDNECELVTHNSPTKATKKIESPKVHSGLHTFELHGLAHIITIAKVDKM
jgi:hypothetical protein